MQASETTLIFALTGKFLDEKHQIDNIDCFRAWFSAHVLVKKLLATINYQFNNMSLLIEAMTHQSFLNENEQLLTNENYQRLEFLGDSVLNFYISSEIFKRSTKDEGILSKNRAALVNEKSLSLLCEKLSIHSICLLGKGPFIQNILRESLSCDLLESLIGAIVIDSDYTTAKKVLDDIFDPDYFNINLEEFDYKSQLQEWSLKEKGVLPTYNYLENDDHSYTVELLIDENFILKANDFSKRKAVEKVATIFLKNISHYNERFKC